MKKIFLPVSWQSLLTIYKSLIRPNLHYVNIIYDKPLKCPFKEKIERVE